MIFEMRTYLMKPGSIPEVEKRWAAALPERLKLSPLAGFWRTEVGSLNQIIHVWPYKDLNERDTIRAKAIEMGIWPPKAAEFILEMESKILHSAPFSPNFQPGQHGNIYEFRTYTYGPGSIPKVIESWSGRIKQRTALSPLIFADFTDIGALNQWVHVWAYKNMGEREKIRGEAVATGVWPPPRHESVTLLKQQSWLCIPASFSPLR
jgi:NIPSNAP